MFEPADKNKQKVTYSVEDRDGTFVIFSKVTPLYADGTGVAINWVAEKSSEEAAWDLVGKLQFL